VNRGGSLTAEAVALFRAAAGDDPYAPAFLGPTFDRLFGLWRRAPVVGRAFDRAALGLVSSVLARHAWFDAEAVRALDAGAAQLVLLGAGFDARPWRLAHALGDRPVFLVDHPATAARRAARAPGAPLADVRRLDVDFGRDDLATALREGGVDPDAPAVVVWEGVSMYLPIAAVRATLTAVRASVGAGSTVLFDAWCSTERGLRARLEGVGRGVVGAMGEPLRWVPSPPEVQQTLDAAGLSLVATRRACDVPGYPRAHPAMHLITATT
jgi:methyltransferase (TIGR00027 family)